MESDVSKTVYEHAKDASEKLQAKKPPMMKRMSDKVAEWLAPFFK